MTSRCLTSASRAEHMFTSDRNVACSQRISCVWFTVNLPFNTSIYLKFNPSYAFTFVLAAHMEHKVDILRKLLLFIINLPAMFFFFVTQDFRGSFGYFRPHVYFDVIFLNFSWDWELFHTRDDVNKEKIIVRQPAQQNNTNESWQPRATNWIKQLQNKNITYIDECSERADIHQGQKFALLWYANLQVQLL